MTRSDSGADAHLVRSGPRACGRLGPGAAERSRPRPAGMATVLERPRVVLVADGAVTWQDGSGATWSPRPLPAQMSGPAAVVARDHDAISVVDHHERAELHAGISGAVPLYLTEDDQGVCFSSSVEALLDGRASISPDWDGWAQMLAAGAPLGGRTTVQGIRRLGPWERVTVDDHGHVAREAGSWPWLDVVPDAVGASTDSVAEALAASVGDLATRGPLAPLLSGGWDSRVLTALTARLSPAQVTARTTSSDTGTVMEELIAAKVAERVGVDHRLLPPSRDQFEADVERFARAVDYQTAFHFWLVPVQRDLHRPETTVLDGLGGGVFLGGAFPDPADSHAPVLDQRFNRLTHYLREATSVLAPQVVDALRERTWVGFEAVAAPLAAHPFASTFTAYLNRTLPGISLAPYGLLAASGRVATPFLDDRVVTAALQLPAHQHADGQLYPQMLSTMDPWLAQLATAADLAPWPRPHPRRIASPEAAAHIRDLVLAEPVRPLISDELAAASMTHWMRLLNGTRSQHLLRGLSVLSLWFTAHASALGGQDALGIVR